MRATSMQLLLCLIAALSQQLLLSLALSISGNRVLVVLDESAVGVGASASASASDSASSDGAADATNAPAAAVAGGRARYSKFWADLEDRGFHLTFSSPKNEKLSLFQHGERSFDHLILFPAKSKGLGPALTPLLLLKFLNSDGNVLLALSSGSPTPATVASLLLELGIQLPPDRVSQVVDHFSYDALSAPEQHDVLLVPAPTEPIRPGVRNYFSGDALSAAAAATSAGEAEEKKGRKESGEAEEEKLIAFPRGVGHTLAHDSPLLAPVLRAPRTAYAFNPKDGDDAAAAVGGGAASAADEPFATGQQLALVSTLQARNSARFVVLGSVEMLEDTWFDAQVQKSGGAGVEEKTTAATTKTKTKKKTRQQRTANRAFARQISAWAFQELGVLRVGDVEHHLNETGVTPSDGSVTLNPKIYRVKNHVTFRIELSEYVYDHFEPFVVPAGDALQLEFTMLSPFHRLTLTPVAAAAAARRNASVYGTSFTLPDQHGIFHFRVNYKRPFLTRVDERRTVTVRHVAHDEWPRSWRIGGAWPWIAGLWATVAAWLVFVALWLWSAPVGDIDNNSNYSSGGSKSGSGNNSSTVSAKKKQ